MQSSYYLLIVFASLLSFACSAHDNNLEEEYTFHRELDPSGRFVLYWRFNLSTETIHFAVDVETEGWVGFGISPTGRMPGSDVVMGWIDDRTGEPHFNDRYAATRGLPSIDAEQNWFLTHSRQTNGHTILEFYRNFSSCDEHDLDIASGTTRVLWSWHQNDPNNNRDFQRHSVMGSTSLSLLGGLPTPRSVPRDSTSEAFLANNVTIPSHKDTTYWCQIKHFSDSTKENEHIYVYRIAPLIAESTKQYVHHILIYACSDDISIDYNVDCDDGNNRMILESCYNGEVVAGWAVGGEEFYFPENVSLEFNTSRTLLLEMHYDNPHLHSGITDNSGMKIYYSLEATPLKAGSLGIGSTTFPTFIIPPNAETYTHEAFCSSTCLDRQLPENGIKIFGSFLHTHLIGKAVGVKHIRKNTECGATEELKPIDSDPYYDFNYQQFNHLPEPVHLKRGDSLILECIYSTKNKRNNVTLGGLGTRNEMCVAFLYYYPKLELFFCGHHLNHSLAYDNFIQEHLRHNSTAINVAMNSLNYYNPDGISESFNQISWTNDTIRQFETAVRNAKHYQVCLFDEAHFYAEEQPKIQCDYQSYDKCTGYQPLSCCDRIREVSPSPSGVTHITAEAFMIMILFIMAAGFI
ncbi:PREDICTED: DBH-like monooxygenase protein 1 homolog [Amphimedon queenslandica]|uniref:DOMON domain-containing protein n=1 Tax=Amphimedon queenslandica TaxID=400682 RepID=A0A1X7VD12_AMPQE|nr:PREDICTED: DBH-like monooxygenase protein 1 homolog [Amphimedon queenslandica]|eukprot:XP_019849476.1 PREDICTED: DBH-like monooxygenase protein 1 homolog [Amphimedon queenslandica]